MELISSTKEIMKKNFLTKYPQANPNKFEFEVILDDDGSRVLDRSILYKMTEDDMIDIESK